MDGQRIERVLGSGELMPWQFAIFLLAMIWLSCSSVANSAEAQPSAAERGYLALRTRAFLPPDFSQKIFDDLWQVWPEPLRERARHATPAERRRMAFVRYGMQEVPGGTGTGPALGYVDDGQGGWVMNCLACHAGTVNGQVFPGSPNTDIDLQTLTEEVRLAKLARLQPLAHLDLASLKLPLNTTRGTSNAVVFGIVLGAIRDAEMHVDVGRPTPRLVHHDMDAPAFWNVKKKRMLYCDGHSPKSHRPIMQFMLIPANTAERVKSWEPDFRDILAWIESVEPPPYPFAIDRPLAERGRALFERECSRCHGRYGEQVSYPERTVPIDELGTDPVRLRALAREHREWMRDSWMSDYGRLPVVTEPAGYVAPPLDGVWATAPYLHNGSVPTLWHLLHPQQRPAVWRRQDDQYDGQRGGLTIQELDAVPEGLNDISERRSYFDTRQPGKSAKGHDFPDILSEEEKRAVLEYLKTL